MNRGRIWAALRLIGGVAILALVGWRVGSGPFIEGFRAINGWSLAVAVAIGAVTTATAAWRWSLVARGLGVAVPLSPAIAAYYRAQFLNTVLPGGVLGDVDRGIRHGRDAGNLGRALRAVGWERSAGQSVQIAVTLAVVLVLPSPVPAGALAAGALVVGAVVGGGLLIRALPRNGRFRRARGVRAVLADLRSGLLARRAWPGVLLGSLVVVAGHVTTYLVAARAVGATAPVLLLLPLALLALVAMAVPANVGGWGPREGVAAWSFAAAGLSAGQGVATATAYGLLVFAASIPGAAVLAAGWLRRTRMRAADGPTSSRASHVAAAARAIPHA
jgi:uncharacterized membrane protein YbhN (UPF0104 family)